MSLIIIFQLILALAIFIEAVALLFGMSVIKKNKEWLTVRNIIIILVDLLTGGILFWITIHSLSGFDSVLTEIYLAIIVSHSYRFAEGFLQQKNKFCFSKTLIIANNLKLIVSIIITLIIFIL